MVKHAVDKDISNKTVVIVLILVIVVSVICLGIYMNAVQGAQFKMNDYSAKFGKTLPPAQTIEDSEAKVSLTIENLNDS